MTRRLTKIDNIKHLLRQVDKAHRPMLIEAVAKEFRVSTATVHWVWFTRFEIPTKFNVQDQLICFMQNYIANQKSAVDRYT